MSNAKLARRTSARGRLHAHRAVIRAGPRKMGFFEGLCWVVVLIAAAAAVWQLFDTFANAQSAPQQAAGAAMSAATVIAPYCFARAVRALSGR